MKLNILIGGKAGQGINKVSEIVSQVLVEQGYFTFNYRDYPSLIRGGHNFNVLSISDERVGSIESKLDDKISFNPHRGTTPTDENVETTLYEEATPAGPMIVHASIQTEPWVAGSIYDTSWMEVWVDWGAGYFLAQSVDLGKPMVTLEFPAYKYKINVWRGADGLGDDLNVFYYIIEEIPQQYIP